MITVGFVWWSEKTLFYVAQHPGDGGKDWGYASKITEDKDLSPYWQRRWMKANKDRGRREGAYGLKITSVENSQQLEEA